MSAQEMVLSICLLNRYCSSRRCRGAAAELVTSLAPLFLPGPFWPWNTVVGGQKLWPALSHRRANKPAVVLFESFPLSWREKRDCVNYVKSSRYDLDVALTVAIVALFLGASVARRF